MAISIPIFTEIKIMRLILAILLLILWLPINGWAQIFELHSPDVWLHPEAHAIAALPDSQFTANYSRLDTSLPEVKQALRYVAQQSAGTLLMVYRRPQSAIDSTQVLIGQIEIREDSMQ